MNTELEKATQFQRRGDTARFAGAVAKVLSLRPPCARCKRNTATRVVGGDEPRAVCKECAESERLDARVRDQRARREAMRRRA